MADPVTAADIALCTNVLQRLSPEILEQHTELATVGTALFRRQVLREHNKLGSDVKRQAQALHGKVQAARAELTKLGNRHSKLSTNITSELAHLSTSLFFS